MYDDFGFERELLNEYVFDDQSSDSTPAQKDYYEEENRTPEYGEGTEEYYDSWKLEYEEAEHGAR